MDIVNIIKIIATIITGAIALVIGLRVLLLNKSDLLNIWFSLYFISTSVGFMIYAIYHLILNNADIIIPLMITGQIFFNFNTIALTMTLIVLERHKKESMSLKYLGTMIILFGVMSIGYFILPPHLDMVEYALERVNTHTDPALFIFVNAIRLLFATYAAIRYSIIARKLEGQTKNRIKWFSLGLFIIILGFVINLTGGLFSSIELEILALIVIDIGAIIILKGFLI